MSQNPKAINQAILSLATSLDLEEVLQNCLESLEQVIPFETSRIFLLSPNESHLVMAGLRKAGRWDEGVDISIPAGGGLLLEIRMQKAPVLISKPNSDARLKSWPIMYNTSQWLGLPLVVREDMIGLLALEKSSPGGFSKEDVSSARVFAGQAAIAIQNAQLFEQVRQGRERQRLLSRQLVEVQEAERRSIARELHDQIGQVLTGLKLVLEMSQRDSDQSRDENIEEALVLVDELMSQVRELSLSLRPAMLDDLGLLPALFWQFDRYTTQTQVQVDFQHRRVEGIRFDPEIETAAYRIVQEALTNVARHAGVTQVTVRLWADDHGLYLQVEDRGGGFDADSALATRLTGGLSGMQERANLLGGQLTIDSEPGERTILSASLPLGSFFERRRKKR
jgi:signal transduction histidine kinase